MIFLVVAAMLAVAGLYVLLAPKGYTAATQIVLDTKIAPPSPIERAPQGLIDMSVVESQLETLRSDRVGLAVVDGLKLDQDPEFVPERGGVFDLIAGLFGLEKERPALSREIRRQIALGTLKQDLALERAGHSYVVNLSVTTRSAEMSARIANALGEAYIAEQLQGALETVQRATGWMEHRVAELREEAVKAAGAVEAFKSERNLIVDASGKLASETELNELAMSLAKARAETAKAEAKLERVAAVLGTGGAAASYRTEIEIARSAEQALQKRMTEVFQETAQSRGNLVTLRDLEDKSEAYKQIYDAFLTQYTRALQQQSFPVTEARVLTAAAVPIANSRPRTGVILLLALVGGLALGVGAALLREYVADPVRSAAQIEDGLALSVIGSVPFVAARGGWFRQRPLSLLGRGRLRSAATDALQAVRVAIEDARAATGSRVVAVASAVDGEGKTTIAYNLAALLAQGGARTLLIDGDFRKRLSWGGKPSGLAALLNGDAGLDDVVERVGAAFDRIAAGRRPRDLDPVTLLGSERLAPVLTSLRERYSAIVIDTPSGLAQVDARRLSALADTLVFVAEWGATALPDLGRAVRSVAGGGTEGREPQVAGVLLNKVARLRRLRR